MTRILTAGFEIPGSFYPFTSWSSNAAIVASAPGAGATYSIGGGNNFAASNAPIAGSPTEVYVKVYGLVDTNALTATLTVRSDVTATLFQIQLIGNSVIRLLVNGTVRVTSSFLASINTWWLMEAHLKMADAGEVSLRVNGVDAGTWNGDTKPGADTGLTYLSVGNANGGSSRWDDIAVNDTTGAEDNSWCGSGHVIALRPNAAGDSTVWTPNTGANYAAVDEVTPDGDTTYVASGTATDKDLYNLATYSFPANTLIRRVWAAAVARKTDSAVDDKIQVGLKSDATEAWSSDYGLSTTYTHIHGPEYTTDPDTGVAWTQGGIDALQVGIKAT